MLHFFPVFLADTEGNKLLDLSVQLESMLICENSLTGTKCIFSDRVMTTNVKLN